MASRDPGELREIVFSELQADAVARSGSTNWVRNAAWEKDIASASKSYQKEKIIRGNENQGFVQSAVKTNIDNTPILKPFNMKTTIHLTQSFQIP